MSKADDPERVQHMIQAAEKALRFSEGKTRADLDDDELLALALVKLLEIVGEAAAQLSPATRRKLASIPWSQIVGMRNRLIHNYDDVDHDVLWQTLQTDLVPLIEELKKAIDLEKPSNG